MGTAVAHPSPRLQVATGLPGRRFDHFFFSGMALLMRVTVLVGFAPSYYLAGLFRAPLPSPLIHVHGALFSCWILLLVTQTSLVSAGRVDLHRRLGIAGFMLACAMGGWVSGRPRMGWFGKPVRQGGDVMFFYIIPLRDMLIFAILIFFAFRARSNPSAHKRLILVATVALMTAALARWPIGLIHRKAPAAALASCLFLVMLMAYDLWSPRKIHRAMARARLSWSSSTRSGFLGFRKLEK